MKLHAHVYRSLCVGLLSVSAAAVLTGCQTQMGGQTLPSAFYLKDDVQYFPAGSEDLLPNQKRALSEYRAEQQAVKDRIENR